MAEPQVVAAIPGVNVPEGFTGANVLQADERPLVHPSVSAHRAKVGKTDTTKPQFIREKEALA
jgi:hypothetical protein